MHGLNLDSSSPENNIYSPIKECDRTLFACLKTTKSNVGPIFFNDFLQFLRKTL